MGVFIIGIDPGASGGFAILHGVGVETPTPHGIHINKMPADMPHGLVRFLTWRCGKEEFGPLKPQRCTAFVERAQAMPKQGVASTFKFGVNYGQLLGLLAAFSIPYHLVAPTVWQRSLGCLSRGDKNVTKAFAKQLFPRVDRLGGGITHATADALLIAEYGRRTWLRQNGAADKADEPPDFWPESPPPELDGVYPTTP